MSNRKNKRRHYSLYALTAAPGNTWFHCRGRRHERGYKAFMQRRTILFASRRSFTEAACEQ